MGKQRCFVSVSQIRARLYQSTGRRLAVLGFGVLVVLVLTTVGTFLFTLILIKFLVSHGYNFMAAAGTASGTVMVSLLGLAAVVRAFSPLLHEVAGILEARKPASAGLVVPPDDTAQSTTESVSRYNRGELGADVATTAIAPPVCPRSPRY